MPRKGHVAKRTVLADPIYSSKPVIKLINRLMIDDRKVEAPSTLYDASSTIQDKTGKELLGVSEEAMNNVVPVLEVRARHISGSNRQISVEVHPERKTTLDLRWLVSYARLRNEHTMDGRSANEVIDASNNVGSAVKKREDIHRMAETSHAFTHYRF